MPNLNSIKYHVLSIKQFIQNTKQSLTPGFSLVELILSLFILGVLGVILVRAAGSLGTRRQADLYATATKIANKDLTTQRNLQFSNIISANNQTCPTYSDLCDSSGKPLLPSGRLDRVVSSYDCADPCPTSKIKRVAVTVTWTVPPGTANKFANVETLIFNGGL